MIDCPLCKQEIPYTCKCDVHCDNCRNNLEECYCDDWCKTCQKYYTDCNCKYFHNSRFIPSYIIVPGKTIIKNFDMTGRLYEKTVFWRDCRNIPDSMQDEFQEMIDNETPLKHWRFIQDVDENSLYEITSQLGYNEEFTIKDDTSWNVQFSRSRIFGQFEVYILTHSRIEYIFAIPSQISKIEEAILCPKKRKKIILLTG